MSRRPHEDFVVGEAMKMAIAEEPVDVEFYFSIGHLTATSLRRSIFFIPR
jgi:hypothetical protein